MYESRVIFFSNTFECDAKKIAVGFQYSLFDGIPLHMLHAVNRTQYGHHAVVYADWARVTSVQRHEVSDSYMAAKANDFVTYCMLEAEHNTD